MFTRIGHLFLISIVLFALFFTACPSPSSGGGSGSDSASEDNTIYLANSDEAVIEFTIDFSGVAEKNRIGFASIEVDEFTDSLNDHYSSSGMGFISQISGDTLAFRVTGARIGYWYTCGVTLYDVIGGETLELSFCATTTVQAVAGSTPSVSSSAYSYYDGRYTGAGTAELTGSINLSFLDQTLMDYCEVKLSADDGNLSTSDPNLYFFAALDGNSSMAYRFTNLDSDYTWSIDACFKDWDESYLALDEYSIYGSSHAVAIASGDNVKDFDALQTFDTNGEYDGSRGEADINGALDISSLPSDTYAVFVYCDAAGFAYTLEYEFCNIEPGDILNYKFSNLDPSIEHTLSFMITTEFSNEYVWATKPSRIVAAADLSDGVTTTVDFILPAP